MVFKNASTYFTSFGTHKNLVVAIREDFTPGFMNGETVHYRDEVLCPGLPRSHSYYMGTWGLHPCFLSFANVF